MRKRAPGCDRCDSEHGRRDAPLREREHHEAQGERGQCGARVRVEEGDVEEDRKQSPPPAERPARDVDERDDEHVRARERREKRRDEPPDRVVLVAAVVDPVLGESGQPLVVETELLAVPPRHAGVPPCLERDEREVGEPDDRDDDRRQRDEPADPAAFLPGEGGETAEPVRRDREQVMPKREQLAPSRRLAAENVLRDREVDDDHDRVGDREDVRGLDGREVTHVPRDHQEGDEEKRLLPGRDDVERRPANPEVPELRHDGVVEHEPDDEERDRDPGEPPRANRRSPPVSARG